VVHLKETPGIETRPIEKLGQRCSTVGEVIFADARVPKNALLGQEGDGFAILMALLSDTRLFAAARALGISQACPDKSIDYARTRVQFGKTIGEFQMIQEQTAEMHVNLEAARVLVYQATSNTDKGRYDVL
jgi:alkylation response protein AidB-like acyl-CoA dehydrogenase